MRNHFKTIAFVFLIMAGLFLLLRFTIRPIISQLSPDVVVSGKSEKQNGLISVGQEAPYFKLNSISGQKISIVDLKGQPLVLTFWSTWNSESVDQIKIFDDYLIENKRDIIKIIMIDSQENQTVGTSFLRRGDYEIETLFDQTGEISEKYGIQTLPTTIFIDGYGVIKEIFVGTLSEKMLVDKIENILQ